MSNKKIFVFGVVNGRPQEMLVDVKANIMYKTTGNASHKNIPAVTNDVKLVITILDGPAFMGGRIETVISLPVDTVIQALTEIPDVLNEGRVMTNKFYNLPSGDKDSFIVKFEREFLQHYAWIRDHFIKRDRWMRLIATKKLLDPQAICNEALVDFVASALVEEE